MAQASPCRVTFEAETFTLVPSSGAPVALDLGDIDIYGVKLADLEETNRFSVGYHAFGGFMYALGPRFTVEAEFKYHFVKGKWKSDSSFVDFSDFDLSGAQVTVGLNYWF